MGSNNLSITLKRSFIGRSGNHKLVVKGLGLKKLNQTVVKPDTKEIRGMINKVSYLLEIKEI